MLDSPAQRWHAERLAENANRWWCAHVPPLSKGRDARPTVTFPATADKLYCLVTEAHVCERLTQVWYLAMKRPEVELASLSHK